MDNHYYQFLLTEIRKVFTKNSVMVNTLADILRIERGAVYRRLRKEVPFTFNEIALIAKHLRISIDRVIGIDTQNTIPFQSRIPDFISPQEEDFSMLDFYTRLIRSTNRSENSEMASIANVLPCELICRFQYLFRFYLFIWNFHLNNDKVIPFAQISIPPDMNRFLEEYTVEVRMFNKTSFIFDDRVFQLFVKDIHYFHTIRLIDREAILKIKEDLFSMLDYLEDMALTGQFKETGKPVNLYVSDVDITTNYTYFESTNINLSMVKIFFLSSVTSMDANIFDKMKKWIQSLIKISTLITLTNEKQRVLYFEKQRKLVNKL
jgi:hypothetical protein